MVQEEKKGNNDNDTFYASLRQTMDKNEYTLSDGTDLSKLGDDDDDDLFDDEPSSLKRFSYAVIVVLILGGFSVLAWYAYQFGSRPVDMDNLRLVKADTVPFKVKPDNPGGMDVPYRDKTIYDSISGRKNTQPKVERLLPSPEEPIDLRKSAYNAVVEQARNPKVKKTPKKIVVLDAPKSQNPAPVKIVKAPVKRVVVKKKVKPVSREDLRSAPKGSVKKEMVIPTSLHALPKYRIQLGAYRTEKSAANEWRRLQKKFPSELNELTYYVERKDLGAKGVFYRLQAGPLKNTSVGRTLCKKLIAGKQGCFFVDSK